MQQYSQVRTRFLTDDERPFESHELDVPLVLEAKELNSIEFLLDFLCGNSEMLQQALYKHGALLLRGFDVTSSRDFDMVASGMRHMRPMDGYFMQEPGRALARGTSNVFETNLYGRTGGGFHRPHFHCESYFTPDVPSILGFCCLKPSKLGGETGLVHMGRAYAELRETLVTTPQCLYQVE